MACVSLLTLDSGIANLAHIKVGQNKQTRLHILFRANILKGTLESDISDVKVHGWGGRCCKSRFIEGWHCVIFELPGKI